MTLNTIALPFINSRPPEWASGFGQDEFGYFAEFAVVTGPQYWNFVTQRMRWIPAGRFLMGSPTDEVKREANEGPQHEVTLSRGFWLADTACTQSLWQAVTGDNPSAFQGEDRPVEQVSFDNVTLFLSKLNELVPGLVACLPTEAQWEYACRAGTTTPFSFSDTITTAQVNYDGNHPYGDSPKGKHRKKTVDVKTLPPNAWGLYEMHGNVWEWCRDCYGLYSPETQFDPSGADTGSGRVLRGGCWSSFARVVRSACRRGLDPGNRLYDLGFRLLSSAGPDRNQQPNK